MANSAQIRHRNFQKLHTDFIDQRLHLPHRGMPGLFAELLGLSDRYLSHITCNRQNIGNNVAPNIAERLKLSRGWLNREHDRLNPPVDENEKLSIETASTLF